MNNEETRLLVEERILLLLEEKRLLQAREELMSLNEVDIAEIIEDVDPMTTALLFRMLPKDLAAEIFAYLPVESQVALINTITDRELKSIVDELYFDDMVDMVEEVPANVAKKILAQSSAEERRLVNQFLQYPEDSAGSIMTIEYANLHPQWTVQRAMEYLKRTGLDRETIYTTYVTDNRKLVGILSLRKLVTADPEEIVGSLMGTEVIAVKTHDDQEEVAKVFSRYGFIAVPVVDSEFRLIGIVTVDDIMDVMEDEITEDMQIMAGTSPNEVPYMETSVWRHSYHRIVWLLVLMISASISGSIISSYETLLQEVLVLSAYIPMLMGTGGNAGSQTTAMVIRGIALGEIEFRDIGQVVWKEFRVGILVSLMLAAANFLRLYFMVKLSLGVSLVVSLTLVLVVISANVIGGALPLLAQKVKIDPAVMAGAVITTIVDALSLVAYFNIAKLIVHL